MRHIIAIAFAAGSMLSITTPVLAQGSCSACHQAGLNGAPKDGDKATWAPRIAKGKEALYQSAINGIGGMPPKGGDTGMSDEDVKAAVDAMVNAAGGWKE